VTKEIFVNNTGYDFITNNDFFVINTHTIPAILTKYTFVKEKWGAINIVNFIDADILDYSKMDSIKSTFEGELSAFSTNIKSGLTIYFKVFVTQYGLSEEITDSILSIKGKEGNRNSVLIPLIVDLSSKSVIHNPKEKHDKIGLIDSLEGHALNLDEYNETFDLEKIQNDIIDTSNRTINNGADENTNVKFKPYATYGLIAINIIVFILGTISGGTQDINVLTKYGAKVNSLIIEGEYWRFITAAFVHIGFAHLAFNMYGLYSIGSLVERIYGRYKFLFIYFIAAILGSITSFIFSPIPSAGASGAIFGLLGALLYIGRKNPKLFSTSFGINVLVVVVFNLLYGFTNKGIDNFGHIGGLIGGYLASNIVGLKYDKKYGLKNLLFFIITFTMLITGTMWGINRNTQSWEYYYQSAIEYYNRNDMQKAKESLDKAQKLEPNNKYVEDLIKYIDSLNN
jgi:rhomboid protease GluP